MLFSLAACKLVITVPPGGVVKSASGNHDCGAGRTCEIDVVDVFFDESFSARSHEDYVFKGWRKKDRYFCGNSTENCVLSTTWMGDYPKIMAILASEQRFFLEPVFEVVPRITRDQIAVRGQVDETSDGFELRGRLTIDTGAQASLEFTDARLSLGFNAEGDLLVMNGVTNLPSPLAGFVTAEQDVRAEVGLYRGSEINADPAFEITLKDERQYLVFLVSQDFDINVYNPVDSSRSEKFTIGTPASGKIILIVDPADQMVYRYGETPLLGAFGEAESQQRLLPYKPWITHTRFPSFDGNRYETISIGVGVKAVDLLNLSGAQVIYEPGFSDINWKDPLNSPVAYKAGFNGAVDFAFSVVGFELFSFDIGRASALFNVNPRRGVMKLAGYLEPDVSWQPDWFTIIPQSRLSMDLTADSDGTLVSNIAGQYESVIPPADLEGSMRLDPRSVTYSGRIRGQSLDLPVSIRFADRTTTATVGVTADFSRAVTEGIDSGFASARDLVEDATAQLEDALRDYEFEVSLRGVRDLIPGAVDTAKTYLARLPDQVYSAVRAEVIKQINANRVCILTVCTPSDSSRNSIATRAASEARSKASSEIARYIPLLDNLKSRANDAGDEALRAGLEAALREIYKNRVFSKRISVTVSFAGISKTVSRTITQEVLSPDLAAKILAAADNMKYLPAASDRVVRGEQLVAGLPDAGIVDDIRDKVKAGNILPPTLTGVTYTVTSGDRYSAGIKFSDGSRYTVDFNVLDVRESIAGITELLANHVISAY
jgi:hypothetical protein